jgi:biopolymer transport protein ExbD
MAKKVPEINASSTADMAFLLLTFFLMTTTMNVDSGILRQLPPMPPEEQPPMDINKRNILLVFVSAANDIMVGGERMDISQISPKVKEFVLNPSNDPTLSEFEITEVENLGNYPISKGVVSLQNDRGTNYGTYIQVQNELTRAFNEIRDEVSRRYFQRPFSELGDDQKKAVSLAVPQKISEAEPRNIGGV